MKIPFSYPDVSPIEIPDADATVLEPRAIRPSRPLEELVERALAAPVDSPSLEDLASPRTRVLVLVDDMTRQTPACPLVTALCRRLDRRGVPKRNVKLLIAAGTHARMTPKEIETKLGPDVPQEYEVNLHHWKAEEQLEKIGFTPDGIPIRVNRMLRQADLLIGVGQIVPHRVMGFTGGATIVQPGVSGAEIIGHTHWQSALYPGCEILGVTENPVRLEVERVARQAGLRFIVNVVMDANQRVLQVVAGNPVAAHRQGAEFSRTIYGVSQGALADIVVAESYPADYDLWQAAKGLYAAELAVRPGGVVILVAPCPGGVAAEHPEVESLGYRGFSEVRAMVERKEISDLVAAAHLVHVGRVIRDRARGIMVSPGINPEVQQHLGFESASTTQEALERAFAITGPSARVTILRQGGHVLPLVGPD